MSIRQMLTLTELQQLSQSDHTYLKRKLADHSILNELLHKSINKHLLYELQCVLDKQPLPRQSTGQFVRGQVGRLTDGVKYPCITRKMTDKEKARYGISK